MLALPTMVGSLAGGVVFQLADLAFLSRLGEAPMAAVLIVNQSLRQVLFMLAMGVGFGAQALVARAAGAGQPGAADHVAGQALLLAAGAALVVAALGTGLPEWLFSLPGPDPSFAADGVAYLRLVFLLAFGIFATQLFQGLLSGAGDTTTPLGVTLVQLGVALFAEWVLIFGQLGAPALGVRGAALGTAIGHAAGLVLAGQVLVRGGSRVRLRREHLLPDGAVLRRIAALSWPPALQLVGALLVNFAFLRLAGRFGAEVQTALAVGLRLSMIAPAVCFPIAGACATLVGQALGAGDPARAWRCVRVGLWVHAPIMWSFAAGVFAFRGTIMASFSDDPEVIRIGSEYLLFTSGSFVLWAFYFVFLRSLQGAGDVLVPMIVSLVTSCGIAIPGAYLLALDAGWGPRGIWVASLLSSAVSTGATGAWLATGRWTRRAPHSGPPAES